MALIAAHANAQITRVMTVQRESTWYKHWQVLSSVNDVTKPLAFAVSQCLCTVIVSPCLVTKLEHELPQATDNEEQGFDRSY